MQQLQEIELSRVPTDAAYRDELCHLLLGQCGRDADHVELRRMAVRMFPELARTANGAPLAALIGHAATVRATTRTVRDERDVTDDRLEMTATEPLAYPASYADLDGEMRAMLVGFCERELGDGRDGPEALANLLRLHGWPYSERTFYVGPWKAARMRQRRREV